MAGRLHRSAPVFTSSMELPIEDWPYLDEGTLQASRSRQVCMTCHWFRHHAGVNCINVLTCKLHQVSARARGAPHPPLPGLDRGPGAAARLGPRGRLSSRSMHVGDRKRPPLSPQEGWIIDGRHVLHFRPTRWDRWSQRLEVTVGELLQDQPVPLLKKRLEISREEALKLWSEKRKEGWQTTAPQWQPPPIPSG